ncbi:hypothetical protein J3Q64DRAFT_1776698 [Phycomyces blakesleeanus]|uniref:Uncharacterized protein n=2 Tax=Phycomyces blakesleeanus TaxID=4837 RepID=A0A167M1D6_PHYB8|nr:hypothetical protein PHYBLDRAFT_182029 [Phycomyces blakesleeanus NRRL 1555(-)]OAD71509.1 hypothetical protein PHYBLDRAFT_182029 [Phycomyces blakesleeanus NRRL 1555(-)]|eukprot:XP_018289549.1 hypothetical protein PHYBLDRAFT_182029 [Phycomyces blakesleeanus NRRL 1555(-)]
MSNLNWCTFCDNAVSAFSNSLYCSEDCLRSDALNRHPLLGYDYAELKDFPRSSSPTLSCTSPRSHSLQSPQRSRSQSSSVQSTPISSPVILSTSSCSSVSSGSTVSSPNMSPIPSYTLPLPQGKPTNYSFHCLSPPAFDLNPIIHHHKEAFPTSPKRRAVFYL